MNIILTTTNLSKMYYINPLLKNKYHESLKDDIIDVLKKSVKIFASKIDQKEKFWALENISFNVEKGEALGIIGSNGAGKTTLLKILAGITPPTTGEARIKGKIASLLKIDIGFHPELTGKENVFLNGAILGFSRKKIMENLDSIITFSGVEKFINTPLKYYSSGMRARLAFSVATADLLKPDIFLIDEVLAVGDAQFYKKCLERMDYLVKKTGSTILFVSHNLQAIKALCKRCLWLENGKIKMLGPSQKAINTYLCSKMNLAQKE